ncbi:MAG: outer membrane lipoprotein-sorting protein [Rhodobiaceae bacterium]|nr:MAG: outer membrane lipoprotein-sorting protein [Rhodobiaceae bacterium]
MMGVGFFKGTQTLLAGGAVAVLLSFAAQAAVPEAVADRLGRDLTPTGAEKAGNADGSIPAWTGGLTAPPAGIGYQAGQRYADPFGDDPVLFTVDGNNIDQYEANLTPGQIALLRTYPTYKMNVYQSRRSCANPASAYAQARVNAVNGRLEVDGNGVVDAVRTTPFPIPNNALEIVWNHTLTYRAFKISAQTVNAVPTRDGNFTPIVVQTDTIINYSNPSVTRTEELENVSVYIIFNTVAPARSAGSVLLVHETLNQAAGARRAWQYSPGTRRVRRAPNIQYDNPGTNADGLSTSDSFDMYNGAPDRYDWTVLGKREVFIAANNYRVQESGVLNEDVIRAGHVNQDLLRYERRRVWEIQADLKPATRHIYGRRQMALDEDGWSIVATTLYDARGELWRAQERWASVAYDHPLCNSAGDVVYDLNAGRYLAAGLGSEEAPVNYDANELSLERYTPASIRQLGVR